MSATAVKLVVLESVASESREVIYRRTWRVHSAQDVLAVIDSLANEGSTGKLHLNIGPGGRLQSAEFEQRQKV
jgi:hypothetical protein